MIESRPAFEHKCLVCNRVWVSGEISPTCKNCEAIEFTVNAFIEKGLNVTSWSLQDDGQVEMVTPQGIVFLEVRNKNSYAYRMQNSTGWQGSDHRLMGWEVEKLNGALSRMTDEDRRHMVRESPRTIMRYA